MEDARVLIDNGLIDVYLAKIMAFNKESLNSDDYAGLDAALDATFSIGGIWKMLEGPHPEIPWRETRFRRYAEAIVSRPMFWPAMAKMLDGPFWHGVSLAMFCVMFAVKTCRLGHSLVFWQEWMPKIAPLMISYSPQMLIDEVERSPILRLMHPFADAKDRIPPLGIIELGWSICFYDAFYAMVIMMNDWMIDDNHEAFVAAMTPELIATLRHYLTLNIGESYFQTQFICQAATTLSYFIMRPRISADDDPRFLARVDRLFELFPDVFDVLLKLGKSISDPNWWSKFHNMMASSVNECNDGQTSRMLPLIKQSAPPVFHSVYVSLTICVLPVMYAIGILANQMSKSKILLPKLLPALPWLVTATELRFFDEVFPKASTTATLMKPVFNPGWERELDAECAYTDFGPGVRTVLQKMPSDVALGAAILRLVDAFPDVLHLSVSKARLERAGMRAMTNGLANKISGNHYYQEKDYWSAIYAYKSSCEICSLSRQFFEATSPIARDLTETEAISHSNMAQCFFKLDLPDQALKQCELSLKLRPNDQKTLLRMQTALQFIAEAKLKEEPPKTTPKPWRSSSDLPPFPKNDSIQPSPLEFAKEIRARKKRNRRKKEAAKAQDSASTSSSTSSAAPAAAIDDEKDDDTQEDYPECIVCFEEQETPFAISPCGHGPLCNVCVGLIKECPMCRKAIKGRMKKSKAAQNFRFFF